MRLGSEYFYDAGIGRNIKSETNRYIFFALLEMDGNYSQSSQFFDIGDTNSGGNVIYLTPSLWFATPHVFIQPGISIPVLQNLKGEQERINYFASLNIGYTF